LNFFSCDIFGHDTASWLTKKKKKKNPRILTLFWRIPTARDDEENRLGPQNALLRPRVPIRVVLPAYKMQSWKFPFNSSRVLSACTLLQSTPVDPSRPHHCQTAAELCRQCPTGASPTTRSGFGFSVSRMFCNLVSLPLKAYRGDLLPQLWCCLESCFGK
jgi:hypothetical protein